MNLPVLGSLFLHLSMPLPTVHCFENGHYLQNTIIESTRKPNAILKKGYKLKNPAGFLCVAAKGVSALKAAGDDGEEPVFFARKKARWTLKPRGRGRTGRNTMNSYYREQT